MYPNEFFGLYPAFPRNDDAFVAISFDSRFDQRWNNVLVPALRDQSICGSPLNPYRADLSKAGDSVLTDILSRIANAKLIVADISAIDKINDRPVRNANVLYEVGLAHAMRLPEEVLLFRSDRDHLDFDVRNVRVHYYNPDADPSQAITCVIETARDSLAELELRRSLAVERAADQLDAVSLDLLMICVSKGLTLSREAGEGSIVGSIPVLDAVRRLLDLGAIRTEYTPLTMLSFNKEFYRPMETKLAYKVTTLGRNICLKALDRFGTTDPVVERMISMVLDSEAADARPAPDVG